MKAFNDDILGQGIVYDVGTNDGNFFRKVIFTGRQMQGGKQILTFKLEETKKSLFINPSYTSWIIEHGETKWDD